MLSKAFCVFCLLVLLLLTPSKTFAAQNFNVSADVLYTVIEEALAHAEFKIKLQNKTTEKYASSYKINVGFENIKNIKAIRNNKEIPVKVLASSGGSIIEFTFTDKVVGKDKVLDFTLTFDTPDIIQNQGNVWELNIPGISNHEEFRDFKVEVKVPESFGKATYIKPEGGSLQDSQVLRFTKEDLQKSGISIAFGQKQHYEFSLSYRLNNPYFFNTTREIALPMKTNYQDVFIESINPKPLQVTQDIDGNWIAEYKLLPLENKTIHVKGIAQVFLVPEKSKTTEEDLKIYLESEKYWEKDDSTIQELAKKYKTPQEIYTYVSNHLTYDFARVSASKPRLGAAYVAKNPTSAVCLEFTDLFIAISRAAGIPAREVDGFAFTQNLTQRPLSKTKDILHAWPEYYDKDLETWIMVDPTWGNTTGGVDYFHVLDFDHLAFVKRGQSSLYPIPPGGNKDIEVIFTRKNPQSRFNSSFTTEFAPEYMAGLPIEGTVTLFNDGNTRLSHQVANAEGRLVNEHNKTVVFENIPPYGHKTASVFLDTPSFLTKREDTITISFGDKRVSKHIAISPFVLTKNSLIVIGGLLIVILITIVFIVAIKTRRLSIFR